MRILKPIMQNNSPLFKCGDGLAHFALTGKAAPPKKNSTFDLNDTEIGLRFQPQSISIEYGGGSGKPLHRLAAASASLNFSCSDGLAD